MSRADEMSEADEHRAQEAPAMPKLGDRIRARLAKRLPKKAAPIEAPPPEILVADGRTWQKVESAKAWRPKVPGETLVGQFVGRTHRAGQHGSYEVVTIMTADGPKAVSGVVIMNLFDVAIPASGSLVRVVFKGSEVGGNGWTYRDFDLFVERGSAPLVGG